MQQTAASYRTSNFVTELQMAGAVIAAILIFAYLRRLPLGLLAGGLATFAALLFVSQLLRREIAGRVKIENLLDARDLLGVENEKQRGELIHAMEELHEQIRARDRVEHQARLLTQDCGERVSLQRSHLGWPPLPCRQPCRQFSMSALVAEVLAKVQAEVLPGAAGRKIYWQIYSLPEVQADPILVRHVLANLFSNAMMSTRLQLRAIIEIASREENGEVIIFVRDNGAGFDSSCANKFFAGLQRQHPQDELEVPRTGLADAQRRISRHGGRMWAESQPGKGATFYFTLPSATILEQRQAAFGAGA